MMQFNALRAAYLEYVDQTVSDYAADFYRDALERALESKDVDLNHLTIEAYADRNGLTYDQAYRLIELGRECYQSHCKMMKGA